MGIYVMTFDRGTYTEKSVVSKVRNLRRSWSIAKYGESHAWHLANKWYATVLNNEITRKEFRPSYAVSTKLPGLSVSRLKGVGSPIVFIRMKKEKGKLRTYQVSLKRHDITFAADRYRSLMSEYNLPVAEVDYVVSELEIAVSAILKDHP